jgi:orotate phosphoribosyltransferase
LTGRDYTTLWVESRLGVFALCGDLMELACDSGLGAAGYGLAGQLFAAAACAHLGQSCAFIRTQPKLHGTRRRFDGALDGPDVRQVYCARHEMDQCVKALAELELEPTEIGMFDLNAADGAFSELQRGPDLPEAAGVALDDVVMLLEGDFTLSSGQPATRYWETLPAAHTFAVARNLDLAADAGLVVGVGHGGCYLGTVASLARAKQPIVVDPLSVTAPVLDQRAVLLDDFVTTGGAFHRSLTALTPAMREQSRCVSLYSSEACPRSRCLSVHCVLPAPERS